MADTDPDPRAPTGAHVNQAQEAQRASVEAQQLLDLELAAYADSAPESATVGPEPDDLSDLRTCVLPLRRLAEAIEVRGRASALHPPRELLALRGQLSTLPHVMCKAGLLCLPHSIS